MKLKKKQVELAEQLVDWWESGGYLREGQASRLRDTLERKVVNWKKIGEYLMGMAVLCLVVAFFYMVADDWIMRALEHLFEMSDWALLVFLMGISLLFYGMAVRWHQRGSKYALSKSTFLLLGSIAFGGALYYLGKLGRMDGFWEVALVLIFAFHVFGVARFFKSVSFCDLGWIALLLWMGLESSRQSQWMGTWMGMNLPLRFLIFSSLLLLAGRGLKNYRQWEFMGISGARMGWLVFWISLWLVALFGNSTIWEEWEKTPAVALLPWGVLMGGIALGLWFVGRHENNRQFIWVGLTGAVAVGYTQFFLFLWEPLHPALFFGLLAVSFWWLGRKAEKLRRL